MKPLIITLLATATIAGLSTVFLICSAFDVSLLCWLDKKLFDLRTKRVNKDKRK